MNRRNRDRLLSVAKMLDHLAADIRRYVKKHTPKRGPRKEATKP